jgi:hypothetical protein
MLTVGELIAKLSQFPSDFVIGAYVEDIDSVVDITGVELNPDNDVEVNIRVDY